MKDSNRWEKFWIIWGKISFFIAIIILISFIINYTSNYSSDIDKDTNTNIFGGDTQKEESVKSFLTEYNGYEVLSVRSGNYSVNAPFFEWYNIKDDTICDSGETICYSDKQYADVEMKSFGSRNDQIWEALIPLGTTFKDAFVYGITIHSEQESCRYIIFGETLRAYFENMTLDRRDLVQNQIDRYKSCS